MLFFAGFSSKGIHGKIVHRACPGGTHPDSGRSRCRRYGTGSHDVAVDREPDRTVLYFDPQPVLLVQPDDPARKGVERRFRSVGNPTDRSGRFSARYRDFCQEVISVVLHAERESRLTVFRELHVVFDETVGCFAAIPFLMKTTRKMEDVIYLMENRF